ncbi:hypothetical protein E1178_18640 [Roseibium hamelinense]|nr:outer membrane protein transport protein [Roseibium hamelinense]MTI45626.1 hypothetical protein [Roseibium hamelinense]
MAGGWDTLGIGSNELLFDPGRFVIEGTYKYVDRNVDYMATSATLFGGVPVPGRATSRATPNIWNYQGALKFQITDDIACMGRVNDPYQIEENLDETWQGRFSLTKTSAGSTAWNASCSYRFQVQDGHFIRAIGGAGIVDLTYYAENLTALSATASAPTKVDLQSADPGWGWRAGIAYEVPQYAIRASVIYDSPVSVDLDGTTEVTGVTAFDSFASITLPQSVELNVQSGIAPKWLASFGVKWVNWSSVEELTVANAAGALTVDRFLGYKDGWTVRAAIGHQFNDWASFQTGIQWDRGIGQTYSDTYSLGVGGSFALNEHMEWSIGTAATYKTPGNGDLTNRASANQAATNYDYGSSWAYAIQTKLKLTY